MTRPWSSSARTRRASESYTQKSCSKCHEDFERASPTSRQAHFWIFPAKTVRDEQPQQGHILVTAPLFTFQLAFFCIFTFCKSQRVSRRSASAPPKTAGMADSTRHKIICNQIIRKFKDFSGYSVSARNYHRLPNSKAHRRVLPLKPRYNANSIGNCYRLSISIIRSGASVKLLGKFLLLRRPFGLFFTTGGLALS